MTEGMADKVEFFQENGYFMQKGFFHDEVIQESVEWLNIQKQKDLAKSWTEQEPGVELAVLTLYDEHASYGPIGALARNEKLLEMASSLLQTKAYRWSSKLNLKAAWHGSAEYWHQDFVYWGERGYAKYDMLQCIIFLEPHSIHNAALNIIPGSHKEGFVEHEMFSNVNGLAKYMIPASVLNRMNKQYDVKTLEAQPGDILFFHSCLAHGSSHNISPDPRKIILSQFSTVQNKSVNCTSNARKFNLKRASFEMKEAKRKYDYFFEKYHNQVNSEEVEFCVPVPSNEK